jgi:hypothetical protein
MELSLNETSRRQDLLTLIGFEWSTRLTLTASLTDLKDGRAVGSISAGTEGKRVLVCWLFIPLFFYVQTVRGPVCQTLGELLGH